MTLGRVEAEALQDVDPHLLLLRIDRMALEGGDQLVASDRPAAEPDVDVPGLVVDAGADELELAGLRAPSTSAICSPPCWMPWQRPIVSTLPWSIAAQVFIAIGLA